QIHKVLPSQIGPILEVTWSTSYLLAQFGAHAAVPARGRIVIRVICPLAVAAVVPPAVHVFLRHDRKIGPEGLVLYWVPLALGFPPARRRRRAPGRRGGHLWAG